MATTLTSSGITFSDGTSINSSADAAGGNLYNLGTISWGVQNRTLTANTRTVYSVGTTISGGNFITDLYLWNTTYNYRRHVGMISVRYITEPTSLTIPTSNTAYNWYWSTDSDRNVFDASGKAGSWKSLGQFENLAQRNNNDAGTNASWGDKIWGGTLHWRYA